jgi:hypothetical protein
MGAAIVLMMIVMFAGGFICGRGMPRTAVDKSLEASYRMVLMKIGSGESGNPQLEAQLALEQEEKK